VDHSLVSRPSISSDPQFSQAEAVLSDTQLDERTLRATLAYAQPGHSILTCKSWPNKSPHFARGILERGHRDATSDTRKIEAMWARHPSASIGLRLERYVVMNADVRPERGIEPQKLRCTKARGDRTRLLGTKRDLTNSVS
jgi:hypothetical protein